MTRPKKEGLDLGYIKAQSLQHTRNGAVLGNVMEIALSTEHSSLCADRSQQVPPYNVCIAGVALAPNTFLCPIQSAGAD